MTSSTTKIDEATLREENDMVSVGEKESIHLRFNVDDALGRLLEPGNIDFNIKMTDITDNSVVLHGVEMCSSDDIATSGCGDKDVSLRSGFFHGDDFVTFKTGLESVDRIDFCDKDAGAHAYE